MFFTVGAHNLSLFTPASLLSVAVVSGFEICSITAVVDDGLREVTCGVNGSDHADVVLKV